METIKKKMGVSGAFKVTLRSCCLLIKNSSILRHLNQIFKDFKPEASTSNINGAKLPGIETNKTANKGFLVCRYCNWIRFDLLVF